MTGRDSIPIPPKPTPTPSPAPIQKTSQNLANRNFSLGNGLWLTNLLLAALFLLQLTHHPKYEYQTVSPSDLTFTDEMNRLGAEGWKTESCRRASERATDIFGYECIMSRQKSGW